MRSLAFLSLGVLFTTAAACAPAEGGESSASAEVKGESTYATAADAPGYDGDGFTHAQILRVRDRQWLDESALATAIAGSAVTYFGEQHQTAPVQALERWVMQKVLAAHADAGLAMEHFQADEQPVIDRYFAGEIDQATFEAQSQPWPEYATYWRALVEDARAAGRPMFALNVPKEVLGGLYAQFPAWPLDVFNGIPADHALSGTIPARPLAAWTDAYQDWFEPSYDYATHGQAWGLSYEDALHYFTDLAQIRDETMAHWTAAALRETPHLFVVAGDWHVQTRLALPDRVTRLAPEATSITLTTGPASALDDILAVTSAGRPVADYVITYR